MLRWLIAFWRETGFVERYCFGLIGATIAAAMLPFSVFLKIVGGVVALCTLLAILMTLVQASSSR